MFRFNNIKTNLKISSIISLTNTNIAYREHYKLEINEITYYFFNKCDNVYINDLSRSIIPLKKIENLIKKVY